MIKDHEIKYIEQMSEKWTDRPLIEHVRHVWFEHGNLFESRVRKEMDGDERAMELLEEFEDSWRELHDYINEKNDEHRRISESRQEVKEKLKEKVKPFVRKELQKIRERGTP
jgi:hypothetical protein